MATCGAAKLVRETLAVRKRCLGDERPDTLASLSILASTLCVRGKYWEAAALDRETLAMRRRILGREHPDTLGTADNLANTLRIQGLHAGASLLLEETLAVKQTGSRSGASRHTHFRKQFSALSAHKASTSRQQPWAERQ